MDASHLKSQWDRVLAIALAVVGAIVLLLGWIGISGASLVTEQVPYLASGAVVGLVLFGVATTLWLSADLRDEWAKLDDIYSALTQRHEDERDLGFAQSEASVDLEEISRAGRGTRRARSAPTAAASGRAE